MGKLVVIPYRGRPLPKEDPECPSCHRDSSVMESLSLNDGGTIFCRWCGEAFHACRDVGAGSVLINKPGTYAQCGCIARQTPRGRIYETEDSFSSPFRT